MDNVLQRCQNIILVTLSMMFLIVLYSTRPIHAQTQTTLSIMPSQYAIVAKPGTSIPLSYSIANDGESQVVIVNVRKVLRTNENNNVAFSHSTYPLTFAPAPDEKHNLRQEVFITKGEKMIFNMSIDIPDHTTYGEYRYIVSVESQTTPIREGKINFDFQYIVGSLLVVNVATQLETPQETKLLPPHVETPFSLTVGKAIVAFPFHKKDIVLTHPIRNQSEHTTHVRGSFSKEEEIHEIPKKYIYANEQINLTMTEEAVKSLIRLGKNTITLELYSGSSREPNRTRTDIIYLPLWIMIMVIFLMVSITLVFISMLLQRIKDRMSYPNNEK